MKKNVLFSLFTLTIVSCELINDNNENNIKTSGIFIVNEGSFNVSNGDVSFYDPETKTVQNNLFLNANGSAAGDVVQDMIIHDTLAVMTVNNSNRIRIASVNTFNKIKDIQIPQPRFIAKVSESQAYITCWDDYVRILNLNTLTITDSIPVGSYPEDIIAHHELVYVANSGFGSDNRLSIINTVSHSIKHVRVGYGPTKIVLNHDEEKLYIACSGNEYSTPKEVGGIYIVDENSQTLLDSIIRIPNQSSFDSLFVTRLAIHDNKAFFIRGYAGPILSYNLITKAVTDTIDGAFYNVEINYENEADHNLYATTSAVLGKFQIYDQTLNKTADLTVGDFPNSIVFRNK